MQSARAVALEPLGAVGSYQVVNIPGEFFAGALAPDPGKTPPGSRAGRGHGMSKLLDHKVAVRAFGGTGRQAAFKGIEGLQAPVQLAGRNSLGTETFGFEIPIEKGDKAVAINIPAMNKIHNLSEFMEEPSQVSGWIIEEVPAHGGGMIGIGIALQAPAESGPGTVAQISDRQDLVMSAVAPVGIEIADGTMAVSVFGGILQVAKAVFGPAGEGTPA